MTPQEIAADLREAARIVAEGAWVADKQQAWYPYFGACAAIFTSDATDAFARVMVDDRNLSADYWWPRDEEHRHVRVMALLFAAEFVERP